MLDAALGDRYVSEFFGLRPEVLLTLYVERGLWDRFLSRAAMGGGGTGRGPGADRTRALSRSAASRRARSDTFVGVSSRTGLL